MDREARPRERFELFVKRAVLVKNFFFWECGCYPAQDLNTRTVLIYEGQNCSYRSSMKAKFFWCALPHLEVSLLPEQRFRVTGLQFLQGLSSRPL